MKLILKKNDSATSLIMFIFNIHLGRTNTDEMKLSSLLRILKVFGKNESAIRMSLSRAVKVGLLKNTRQDNEVSYSLTTEGKKSIIYWNEGVTNYFTRYQRRHKQWNQQWHFLNFQFTEDHREIKIDFFDKLQQQGFVAINPNTWLSPYDDSTEVNRIIDFYNLEKETLEVHGQLIIHKDMNEFLNELYNFNSLRSGYRIFLTNYLNQLPEIKRTYKDTNFVQNGLALPLLHSLGFDFFKMAANDPILPLDLLPYWEGDSATSLLHEARQYLLEASYRYLELIT